MHSKHIFFLTLVTSLILTSCQKLAIEPDTSNEDISTTSEGLNYWGGDYNDEGLAVIQTADGGYAVAGSQYSASAQDELTLVKFSSKLEFEDKKNFGGEGADSSFSNTAKDIKQTKDGGYIMVGSTYNNTNGDFDVWIVKFAPDLTLTWEQTIAGETAGSGAVTTGYDDFGSSIQELDNGNYLVCGTSYDVTNNDRDAMLWTIGSDGTGAASIYNEADELSHDDCEYAEKTMDGGYIMVTTSITLSSAARDTEVIKLDKDGALDATFTDGNLEITGSDIGVFVQERSEDGYIVVGNTQVSGRQLDAYVNTISRAGVASTAVTFGQALDDKVYCVRQTRDGGYVFVGSQYTSDAQADVWVVKLTPALTLDWQATFGGEKNDIGTSISQTDDGGYIVTGSTNSYGMQSEIILLKLGSDGRIDDIIGNLNTTSTN